MHVFHRCWCLSYFLRQDVPVAANNGAIQILDSLLDMLSGDTSNTEAINLMLMVGFFSELILALTTQRLDVRLLKVYNPW